jgi:hypothetical protein
MPTSDQIVMLLNQRGSLRLSEICNYFGLTSQPWVAPVTATLNALIAAGTVFQDAYGAYLLTFAG